MFLPDAPLTMRLRWWLYSFGMQSCGSNFQVSSTTVLRGLEKISCGRDVYIGPNAFVMARESIISDEVLVAMNVVVVVDGNHGKNKETNSYRFCTGRRAEITIGSRSWVAANCVITAGSTIGKGQLVPPCTVVRGELS